MTFYLSKALPILTRQSHIVVGWLCTIHADFEGGSGFDELQFPVPASEHRPLKDWTTVLLREFLNVHCHHHDGFHRFITCMAFRRDYVIQQDFSLTQLGEESHVYLTCPELPQ